MSRSEKKRARSHAVVNEDELALALERVVPDMAVASVALVAEELAAHFGVAADAIKDTYRDFLLVHIPPLIRNEGNTSDGDVDRTPMVQHSRTNAASTTVMPRKKLTTKKQLKNTGPVTTTNKLPSTAKSPTNSDSLASQNRTLVTSTGDRTSVRSTDAVSSLPSPPAKKRAIATAGREHSHVMKQEDKKRRATDLGSITLGKRRANHLDTTDSSHAIAFSTKPSTKSVYSNTPPPSGKEKLTKQVDRSSDAAPSPRGLTNLKELAKVAGLLSPRTKLWNSLKTATTDAERAEKLRGALETERIVFRGRYPTKTDISACKVARERLKELEDMDERNILPPTTTHRSVHHKKLRLSDPPALRRGDPARHFVFAEDEEKEDDSDASSAPSITALSD